MIKEVKSIKHINKCRKTRIYILTRNSRALKVSKLLIMLICGEMRIISLYQNNIGAPKMQNNYGASVLSLFNIAIDI